jgi:hypothetical protein
LFQKLYEESRHHQATAAHEDLKALDAKLGHPKSTLNLLDLYRLFKGPIARKLNNEVAAFLPVDPKVPGKNVYPWGVTKAEIDDFLERHPEKKESILHLRKVVRRVSRENLKSDLDVLERHRDILGMLHPGLAEELEGLEAAGSEGFYAVPYSVAYAEDIMSAYAMLNRASALIESTDVEFSRYLKHRAVDLLRDDYESGDAAWVTGRFGHLNAQIGSYESYDDELYGVKSFFSLSLLAKDRMMSSSVGTVVKWLQEMEDLLPYEPHKSVRKDIPIGAYNVIADFGQSRGTNTATILPNESYITQKYGRTILLRYNILTHPELFAVRQAAFNAAMEEEFHQHYDSKGDFFRTLWHEIGHYLGPDMDKTGRSLDIALEEDASILEELKSDLEALFLSKRLLKKGYFDMPRFRAVQASGIRRVLLKNQPRKAQVYQTMQLMQFNYFMEKGALEFDAKRKKLRIHFDKFHPTMTDMLREVLALQYNGDKAAADRFIDQYSAWTKNVHGAIAGEMKRSEKYRYGLVRYAALGE